MEVSGSTCTPAGHLPAGWYHAVRVLEVKPGEKQLFGHQVGVSPSRGVCRGPEALLTLPSRGLDPAPIPSPAQLSKRLRCLVWANPLLTCQPSFLGPIGVQCKQSDLQGE